MASPDPRKSSPTDDPETAANFAAFLATVRPGTVGELSDGLRELVRKVRDTGKQGTLSLTLTIKPLSDDTSVLTVNDEIRIKAPEHSRRGSLAYPDGYGNLTRTDPSAMPLFDDDLRTPTFDAATGEIKEPRTDA